MPVVKLKETVEKVACWFESNYCAITTSNGSVRLFSIEQKTFLTQLSTIQDIGGISVAISPDDRFCFVGTYYAWGLACFEINSGELIWKRDDLRRFYGLSFSAAQRSLFGYFHGKSAVRIDPQNGQTLESFRGITDVYASPVGKETLFADRRRFTLYFSGDDKIWSVPRESFGVLDVGWSTKTVAVSEVSEVDGPKAGIRCYSMHGELLWRYYARKGHTSPIMFNPSKRHYVGVDFAPGLEDRLLLSWDEETGEIKEERVIPAAMHGKFCAKGELMFCIDYRTFETTVYDV